MHWALSMLIVYWDNQPETLFCQVPDSGPLCNIYITAIKCYVQALNHEYLHETSDTTTSQQKSAHGHVLLGPGAPYIGLNLRVSKVTTIHCSFKSMSVHQHQFRHRSYILRRICDL